MKEVSLSALLTGRLYPMEVFLVLNFYLYYKLSQSQDHSAAGRIMSTKNSSDANGNQTRDLQACSAESQPTAPPGK
jgi:hypothetical protein